MVDLVKIKAELLCKGVCIAENTRDELFKEYPHFFEKGFVDAVNAKIGGSNVCISIAEAYSEKSPFVLEKMQGQYFVVKNGEKYKIDFFENLPKTDTVIDELARLHADDCINIWPSTSCCFDTPEQKCKFCSLECKNSMPIEPDVLCDGIKKLFEKIPPKTLNFSGGTYRNPDYMLDYWCTLVRKIREFSLCKIAVEFAPPEDLTKIKNLKQAGASAAIMNLEIADDALRREICPGKSRISYEHYYSAFELAVKEFGFGQVSTVLIGGIQPKEDILRECEKLCKIGVFPTIMPFRPMDNCDFALLKPCESEELIEMGIALGKMLVEYKLSPFKQAGCTKCGGCSIENDCYYKEKNSKC